MDDPTHDPRPLLRRGKIVLTLWGDVVLLLALLIGWGAGALDGQALGAAFLALGLNHGTGAWAAGHTDGKRMQRPSVGMGDGDGR